MFYDTLNVDIFACIYFRGFMNIDNFACINICVLCIIGSLGYYKCYFRGVHIFADISETRITQKYVQRENIYAHSNLSVPSGIEIEKIPIQNDMCDFLKCFIIELQSEKNTI